MSDAPVQGGSGGPAVPAQGLSAPAAIAPPGPLERQLGGDLPCVVCRYNLRGLSIRSVCPECGTAVRATILALVDPHAAELEPIIRPRRVALGLVVWIGGALLAMLLAWLPAPASAFMYQSWHAMVTCGVVASGLGAMALVKPHVGARRRGVLLAWAGVALYVPLTWLVWEVTSWQHTAGRSAVVPFVGSGMQAVAPASVRVLTCILVGAIAVLLRPNARLLVARSLALRTGRVDRQTILAILAAATIAATGEATIGFSRWFPGSPGDSARLAGEILVAAGWALVTLGLVGSMVDAVRIARSIVMPAPSLGDVLEKA